VLEDEELTRVWLEVGIRVGPDGIPLSVPVPTARPIAVETNRKLYTVTERFDNSRGSQMGHMIVFKNQIFDLSTCSQGDCGDIAMSEYVKALENTFATDLSARMLRNLRFPRGEVWFGQSYEQSLVLGPPWYEVSRYVVQWFGREAAVMIDTSSGKGRTSAKRLFLIVDQEYTLSPNRNGTYLDARPDQEDRYKRAVDSVVRTALANACETIKGLMVEKVVDGQFESYCSVSKVSR
jgi:hypothetical protein